MDLEEFLKRPAIQRFLNYYQVQEARPRIACTECQFEYVEEEGHECGQGQVPTT